MKFQQIRSAAIKLYYNDVVFLIDPWLRDSSDAPEVLAAKAAGNFISTPVIPLPMPAPEVLADVNYILVSHMHADHFTPDHLPKDVPLIFQNEADRCVAEEMGFTNTSSAAKAENGIALRQSMRANKRATVFFKVFCITSSFLWYQIVVLFASTGFLTLHPSFR